jgi:putative flippase GtrA
MFRNGLRCPTASATTEGKREMGRLFEQIAKFGIVGVIATVIDYGILMLLSQAFGMNPVIAAGISFCVSLVFNYMASMRFVFSHREDMSKGREFAIFIVLSAIGLALNEAIMHVGVAMLGTSALAVTIEKCVATGIVMVWNFVSRKKWLDAGDGTASGSSARRAA